MAGNAHPRRVRPRRCSSDLAVGVIHTTQSVSGSHYTPILGRHRPGLLTVTQGPISTGSPVGVRGSPHRRRRGLGGRTWALRGLQVEAEHHFRLRCIVWNSPRGPSLSGKACASGRTGELAASPRSPWTEDGPGPPAGSGRTRARSPPLPTPWRPLSLSRTPPTSQSRCLRDRMGLHSIRTHVESLRVRHQTGALASRSSQSS